MAALSSMPLPSPNNPNNSPYYHHLPYPRSSPSLAPRPVALPNASPSMTPTMTPRFHTVDTRERGKTPPRVAVPGPLNTYQVMLPKFHLDTGEEEEPRWHISSPHSPTSQLRKLAPSPSSSSTSSPHHNAAGTGTAGGGVAGTPSHFASSKALKAVHISAPLRTVVPGEPPQPSPLPSPLSPPSLRHSPSPLLPRVTPTQRAVSAPASSLTSLPPPSLLHASHVYIRTSSTLLARWQKRWLLLSQEHHPPPPRWILHIFHKPGELDALESIRITDQCAVNGEVDKKKPCRFQLQINAERTLVFECMNANDHQQWIMAIQQAILLHKHSVPTHSASLPFPPPTQGQATPAQTHTSLTAFELYFFHLYYSLPEVGYVHAQYDLAMRKFRVKFEDEMSIVQFLLESVKEERRKTTSQMGIGVVMDGNSTTATTRNTDKQAVEDGAGVEGDSVAGDLSINDSAVAVYLTSRFPASTLPALLLSHCITSNGPLHHGSVKQANNNNNNNAAAISLTLADVVTATEIVDPISQSQIDPVITPRPSTERPTPATPTAAFSKQRFEQKLHAPATLHHLAPLLYTPHPKGPHLSVSSANAAAQALSATAFRLLWLLLANIFPDHVAGSVFMEYLESLAAHYHGSLAMINTLRILLFADNLYQHETLANPNSSSLFTVGLRAPFVRVSSLSALLSSLAFASFSIRDTTLRDLSSSLLHSPANAALFRSQQGWQQYLFTLLTDVQYNMVKDIGNDEIKEEKLNKMRSPQHILQQVDNQREVPAHTTPATTLHPASADPSSNTPVRVDTSKAGHMHVVWEDEDLTQHPDYQHQRNVFSFVFNLFAIIHYKAFATSYDFYTVFSNTLDALFIFAGPRASTQKTAVLLLQTLLNLIDKNISKRTLFQQHDGFTAIEWLNLSECCQLLRTYIFYSHHWIATDTDTHTYLLPAMTTRMVLYASKFRHPAFIPFHAVMQQPTLENVSIGVHFDEEGAAADLPLLRRLLTILSALHLSVMDVHLYKAVPTEDQQLYLQLYDQYMFFAAALSFLSTLQDRLQHNDTITIKMLRDAVVKFMSEEEDKKHKRDKERKTQWKQQLKQKRNKSTHSHPGANNSITGSSSTTSSTGIVSRLTGRGGENRPSSNTATLRSHEDSTTPQQHRRVSRNTANPAGITNAPEHSSSAIQTTQGRQVVLKPPSSNAASKDFKSNGVVANQQTTATSAMRQQQQSQAPLPPSSASITTQPKPVSPVPPTSTTPSPPLNTTATSPPPVSDAAYSSPEVLNRTILQVPDRTPNMPYVTPSKTANSKQSSAASTTSATPSDSASFTVHSQPPTPNLIHNTPIQHITQSGHYYNHQQSSPIQMHYAQSVPLPSARVVTTSGSMMSSNITSTAAPQTSRPAHPPNYQSKPVSLLGLSSAELERYANMTKMIDEQLQKEQEQEAQEKEKQRQQQLLQVPGPAEKGVLRPGRSSTEQAEDDSSDSVNQSISVASINSRNSTAPNTAPPSPLRTTA